jgi:hypothetical protein
MSDARISSETQRVQAPCASAAHSAGALASIPGKLELPQEYNDTYRGWPVAPKHEQHPIRGSFLDPRPDPEFGATYHDGVDIAVRDDQPERGAPPNRTHRVYAIEGGKVLQATPRGRRGFARIGHFGYGHVDPLVQTGDTVRAGQHIGWSCKGTWHVHLREFVFTDGGDVVIVNPLRRGGKLHPFVDDAAPAIREIRFYTPATPEWGRRAGTTVARLPPAGRRLDRNALLGRVDVRVRMNDPQSFVGWFRELPRLAAPHHPFRLVVTIAGLPSGRVVRRREVFRSEQLLGLPPGQHYAPGTDQNLPANGCLRAARSLRCDGVYWFRLFPLRFWDTTQLADGRYRLRVRAWDVAGNDAIRDVVVRIANGV